MDVMGDLFCTMVIFGSNEYCLVHPGHGTSNHHFYFKLQYQETGPDDTAVQATVKTHYKVGVALWSSTTLKLVWFYPILQEWCQTFKHLLLVLNKYCTEWLNWLENSRKSPIALPSQASVKTLQGGRGTYKLYHFKLSSSRLTSSMRPLL